MKIKKTQSNNTKYEVQQEKHMVSIQVQKYKESTGKDRQKDYAFVGKTRQCLQDQQMAQKTKLDHRQ